MKKVLSFISACLLCISCIGFNASANALYPYDSDDEHFSGLYLHASQFFSENYPDLDISSLDYIYYQEPNSKEYGLYFFDSPSFDEHEPFFSANYLVVPLNTNVYCYFAYQKGEVSLRNNDIGYANLVYIKELDDILYSTFPIYDSEGEEVFNPVSEDLKAPIAVSFTPELYNDMSGGTISYPSKQGANGSEVTQQVYNYTCHVALTENFLDRVNDTQSSLAQGYTYQFTAFIVPSEFASSDIVTMSSKSVYTCASVGSYDYYEKYESISLDEDHNIAIATDDEDEYIGDYKPITGVYDDTDPKNAKATGITNIYIIPRTPGYIDFNINMQYVDWASYDYDSYNVIIFAHLIANTDVGYTGYPLYFKSDYSDLVRQSVNTYPLNFKSNDDNKVTLYEYYTVVSDSFSWSNDDVPPYLEPTVRTDEDGNPWIPSLNPLDFNNLTNSIQTPYDVTHNTSKTPSEFKEYVNDWNIGENFSSDNFTDFGDLFSTSGSFFEFLTSCLKILPSWFLAIFTAFFTLLLALALIKFILD